jgi:hypothetical protein
MPSFVCIRASYSSCIALHQRSSSKASKSLDGSPVDVNMPYQIVPSVYFFGLQIPCCNHVVVLELEEAEEDQRQQRPQMIHLN